jgi:hypothetical protein
MNTVLWSLVSGSWFGVVKGYGISFQILIDIKGGSAKRGA